jgi:hypothetical protein
VHDVQYAASVGGEGGQIRDRLARGYVHLLLQYPVTVGDEALCHVREEVFVDIGQHDDASGAHSASD